MEEYIGSQQHFEDCINEHYDQVEEMHRQMEKDMQNQISREAQEERAEQSKLIITLDDYCYNCADGCCTNYGTVVKVDGVEMPFHNQDVKTILEQVLQHLGYDVQITQTDSGE